MSARLPLALAALAGFLAVAVGAFAAHGVADPRAKELLHTASQYAIAHALATFAAGWIAERGGRTAAIAQWLFLAGVVLFSGSLVGLALGAPATIGVVTPVGGLCYLAGWLALAWAARATASKAAR
jgi:uncharacterized membrane protein YgdD (TMEM256/DUF423 family)